MKQIKTDPNAKSLLKKIVIFTGGALLIVILTASIVYQIFLRALEQEVQNMNQHTAHELTSRMEEVIEQSNRIAAEILADSDVHLFFTHYDPGVLLEDYYTQLEQHFRISGIDYIDSVILYAPRYERIIYGDDPEQVYRLSEAERLPELYDLSWLDSIPENERTATVLCTRAKCDRWPYYLSLVKRYRAGKIDGVAVVNIDLQKLHDHLVSNKTEMVQLYIVDEAQQVILMANKQTLYEPVENVPFLSNYQPQETFSQLQMSSQNSFAYTQEFSEEYGLTCVAITQIGDYMVRLSQLRSRFLAVITIAAIVVIVLGCAYSIRQNRPLQDIRHFLENTDQPKDTMEYQEEIRDIVDRIISHVQSNSQLRQELDSRMELLKDSQMIALQTQINPHFLFNTLNVISLMTESDCGDGHPAVQMLSELSEILRYSLSEAQNVRICEEIAYVKRYLYIMKYRYEDFQVSIQLEDGIKNYAIPKLVLQPLIENALQHGLINCPDGKTRILKVQARAITYTYQTGNTLRSICLDVIDNGSGMNEKKLAEIRASIASPSKISKSHIGLSNVAHRFYLLFYREHEFFLESEVNKGTSVRIIFPAIPPTESGY